MTIYSGPIAAIVLTIGLLASAPGQARVVSQLPVVDAATGSVIEVKRGGRGYAKHNRGLHYGWSRGRGHAYGRKRKFGW